MNPVEWFFKFFEWLGLTPRTDSDALSPDRAQFEREARAKMLFLVGALLSVAAAIIVMGVSIPAAIAGLLAGLGVSSLAALWMLRFYAKRSSVIQVFIPKKVGPNAYAIYLKQLAQALDAIDPQIRSLLLPDSVPTLRNVFVQPLFGPWRRGRVFAESEPQTLRQLMAQHSRLILVGEAGAGKSAAAKSLALRQIRQSLGESEPEPGWEFLRHRYVQPADEPNIFTRLSASARRMVARLFGETEERETDLVPIFVRLIEVPWDEGQSLSIRGMLRWAVQRFPGDADSAQTAADQVDTWLQRGLILAIFDGLDEITPEQQGRFVAGLGDPSTPSRVIMTSRPEALERVLDALTPEHPVLNQFVAAEVRVWDAHQGYSLIDRWFGKPEQTGLIAFVDRMRTGARSQATDSAAAVSKIGHGYTDPRTSSLVSNPFLLSVIIALFKSRWISDLPRSRAKLYEECLSYLLRRRGTDHQHQITTRRTLEVLACGMQRVNLTLFKLPLPKNSNLDQWLHEHNESLSVEWLDSVAETTGVISRLPRGYVFTRDAFREYLAAQYWKKADWNQPAGMSLAEAAQGGNAGYAPEGRKLQLEVGAVKALDFDLVIRKAVSAEPVERETWQTTLVLLADSILEDLDPRVSPQPLPEEVRQFADSMLDLYRRITRAISTPENETHRDFAEISLILRCLYELPPEAETKAASLRHLVAERDRWVQEFNDLVIKADRWEMLNKYLAENLRAARELGVTLDAFDPPFWEAATTGLDNPSRWRTCLATLRRLDTDRAVAIILNRLENHLGQMEAFSEDDPFTAALQQALIFMGPPARTRLIGLLKSGAKGNALRCFAASALGHLGFSSEADGALRDALAIAQDNSQFSRTIVLSLARFGRFEWNNLREHRNEIEGWWRKHPNAAIDGLSLILETQPDLIFELIDDQGARVDRARRDQVVTILSQLTETIIKQLVNDLAGTLRQRHTRWRLLARLDTYGPPGLTASITHLSLFLDLHKALVRLSLCLEGAERAASHPQPSVSLALVQLVEYAAAATHRWPEPRYKVKIERPSAKRREVDLPLRIPQLAKRAVQALKQTRSGNDQVKQ